MHCAHRPQEILNASCQAEGNLYRAESSLQKLRNVFDSFKALCWVIN